MMMILEGTPANANDLNKVKDFCCRWLTLLGFIDLQQQATRGKCKCKTLFISPNKTSLHRYSKLLHFDWCSFWLNLKRNRTWCFLVKCNPTHAGVWITTVAMEISDMYFWPNHLKIALQPCNFGQGYVYLTLLHCDTLLSILRLGVRPNTSGYVINWDFLFHSNVLSTMSTFMSWFPILGWIHDTYNTQEDK